MIIDKVISVIIPAYNAEKYIGQCIDSLLCQTYKNLEIIVIDDGSTDSTSEIVERFPVKLIKQENQGVSAARNRGILEATGEYIHFMDADDYLNVHFYENLINAAISTNSELACCAVHHERLPLFSTNFKEMIVLSSSEDKIWETDVGDQGYSYKYLIKKELIDRYCHEFDKSISVGEDLVFSFKLVHWSNRVVVVPNAIYYYKLRADSLMTSNNKLLKATRSKSLKRARKIIDDFIIENNLPIKGKPIYFSIKYKLMGLIPLITKRVYKTGKIRWYMLGLCLMQIKRS